MISCRGSSSVRNCRDLVLARNSHQLALACHGEGSRLPGREQVSRSEGRNSVSTALTDAKAKITCRDKAQHHKGDECPGPHDGTWKHKQIGDEDDTHTD